MDARLRVVCRSSRSPSIFVPRSPTRSPSRAALGSDPRAVSASPRVSLNASTFAPRIPRVGHGRRRFAPRSRTPQESPVARCEHQDDSYVHCQPFPEAVSEEQEIDGDNDGYHQRHVKCSSCPCSHVIPRASGRRFARTRCRQAIVASRHRSVGRRFTGRADAGRG